MRPLSPPPFLALAAGGCLVDTPRAPARRCPVPPAGAYCIVSTRPQPPPPSREAPTAPASAPPARLPGMAGPEGCAPAGPGLLRPAPGGRIGPEPACRMPAAAHHGTQASTSPRPSTPRQHRAHTRPAHTRPHVRPRAQRFRPNVRFQPARSAPWPRGAAGPRSRLQLRVQQAAAYSAAALLRALAPGSTRGPRAGPAAPQTDARCRPPIRPPAPSRPGRDPAVGAPAAVAHRSGHRPARRRRRPVTPRLGYHS